ncbi:hypothetical protein OS493_039752 [Desmophyllum pertusum]|uniref:Uncharacterized protein n=1 Tax=Desmophyllum pertusum TaxID=174260 RepID=A0A9W9ZUJ2_9CNID|nr:hypothetical protein OS493_039752 [Desmophyllum pertusum]
MRLIALIPGESDSDQIYTRLGELKKYGTVMAALTGTATPHTLQDAVDMAQELKKHNISVTYVHGTLSDTDRKKNEELWSNGNVKVMLCNEVLWNGDR